MVRSIPFLLVLLLSIVSAQAQAISINAKLNTTKVTEGDTVKLTITIDQTADGKAPDFSVLNEHFEIISTFKAERSNILNGRFVSFTSWILTLLPKHTGYIAVPPIRYDNVTSKPLKLHVTKRSSASNSEQYLFVDAKIDKQQAYVQEQVILTVRIFSGNIDIYDPSYQPPAIENAAMEQLGEQRNYKTTLNGTQYDVFEFRYAVFPQKSGTIQIPGARLEATVFRSRSRNYYDPLNGKQVRRYSPNLELEVKPKPAEYPADQPWLPAQSLQLSESWSPDAGNANIGEPITRTVSMQAEGVLSTILPTVPTSDIEGVRIYPEQAESNSSVGEHGIVSTRTESQALIATQAGTIELPAIDVTWWDVEEQAVKVTSLPARTIQVTGTNSRPQTDSSAAQAPPLSSAGESPPPPLGQTSINQTWQWIAVAFFCLWLLTLALLIWALLSRRANSRATGQEDNQASPFSAGQLREANKALQAACKAQDAKAARIAVIELFRQQFRDSTIRNLDDVAQKAGTDALPGALRDLEAHLYKNKNEAKWNSEALLKATQEALSRPATKDQKQVLQPLYPS